jgi:ORF6N domain
MAKSVISVVTVERSIRVLRGHRVLLDTDLALLYRVETKRLNEAVKRNRARFPEDFAFRITAAEAGDLKSQFATSSSHGGRRRSLSMAFTEQGVAMISSVLGSPRAIAVNIEIMRAFVKMRQAIAINAELAKRLALVEAKLDQHRAEFGKATGETSRQLAEHEKHIRIVFETIRRLRPALGSDCARLGVAKKRCLRGCGSFKAGG